MPLELRDPGALAALACIITATPGTSWVRYDRAASVLTMHVLDLVDEDAWVAPVQGALRAPPEGDLRMNPDFVSLAALGAAQVLLALAMACALLAPAARARAQDRVLALDTLYVERDAARPDVRHPRGQPPYFEAALVIGMLGFVSTAALAKFLLRGEVIE